MEVFKLTKLLETSYLYVTLEKDLNNLITKAQVAIDTGVISHMPNDEQVRYIQEAAANHTLPIIDLADMHVTDTASRTIAFLQGRSVRFIDTANEGRNNVLEYNELHVNDAKYKETILPLYDVKTPLEDYIRNLNPDAYYVLTNEQSDIQFAVAAITLIVRPKIRFILSNIVGKNFLIWLHKHLKMSDFRNHTDFLAIIKPAKLNTAFVDNVTNDVVNGVIETREKLHMDYVLAWNELTLIPDIFGKPNIHKTYKNELSGVISAATLTLKNAYINSSNDLMTLLLELNEEG